MFAIVSITADHSGRIRDAISNYTRDVSEFGLKLDRTSELVYRGSPEDAVPHFVRCVNAANNVRNTFVPWEVMMYGSDRNFISFENVEGEWVVLVRDENSEAWNDEIKLLSIEGTGVDIVLMGRKLADQSGMEIISRAVKWEQGRLWFVCEQKGRYGDDGQQLEAGWYGFMWNQENNTIEFHGRELSKNKNMKVDGYRPENCPDTGSENIKKTISGYIATKRKVPKTTPSPIGAVIVPPEAEKAA